MTQEEFKALKPNNIFYRYYDNILFGLVEYTILYHDNHRYHMCTNSASSEMSNIFMTEYGNYELSPELAKINFIKEFEYNTKGTIRKYESKIRAQEKKLINMKAKINYNELLENHAEEFI